MSTSDRKVVEPELKLLGSGAAFRTQLLATCICPRQSTLVMLTREQFVRIIASTRH